MSDTPDGRISALEGAFREFKDGITKSLAGLDTLLWRAILGGIAAVVSLWLGLAALYKEIAGLDGRMGVIENKLTNLQTTTGNVAQAITGLPNATELRDIANEARPQTDEVYRLARVV
jgi:hypothetical protein